MKNIFIGLFLALFGWIICLTIWFNELTHLVTQEADIVHELVTVDNERHGHD